MTRNSKQEIRNTKERILHRGRPDPVGVNSNTEFTEDSAESGCGLTYQVVPFFGFNDNL